MVISGLDNRRPLVLFHLVIVEYIKSVYTLMKEQREPEVEAEAPPTPIGTHFITSEMGLSPNWIRAIGCCCSLGPH